MRLLTCRGAGAALQRAGFGWAWLGRGCLHKEERSERAEIERPSATRGSQPGNPPRTPTCTMSHRGLT